MTLEEAKANWKTHTKAWTGLPFVIWHPPREDREGFISFSNWYERNHGYSTIIMPLWYTQYLKFKVLFKTLKNPKKPKDQYPVILINLFGPTRPCTPAGLHFNNIMGYMIENDAPSSLIRDLRGLYQLTVPPFIRT